MSVTCLNTHHPHHLTRQEPQLVTREGRNGVHTDLPQSKSAERRKSKPAMVRSSSAPRCDSRRKGHLLCLQPCFLTLVSTLPPWSTEVLPCVSFVGVNNTTTLEQHIEDCLLGLMVRIGWGANASGSSWAPRPVGCPPPHSPTVGAHKWQLHFPKPVACPGPSVTTQSCATRPWTRRHPTPTPTPCLPFPLLRPLAAPGPDPRHPHHRTTQDPLSLSGSSGAGRGVQGLQWELGLQSLELGPVILMQTRAVTVSVQVTLQQPRDSNGCGSR
jgi:hypothetical protein